MNAPDPRVSVPSAGVGNPRQDMYDLLSGRRAGHMGEYGYLGEGTKTVEEFFATCEAYYPCSAEKKSFTSNARTFASQIERTRRLVIIGPGPVDSLRGKEMKLLAYLPDLEEVNLVDVSEGFCVDGEEALHTYFNAISRDGVRIKKFVMDYTGLAAELPVMDNTTVISTGGLISNMARIEGEQYPRDQMLAFLRVMKDIASKGAKGKVVLGYDSNDDPQKIHAAYKSNLFKDYIGHSFLNALRMAEFSSNVNDLPSLTYHFDIETEWQPPTAEHCLVAKKQTVLSCGDDRFVIKKGRRFVILNSVKPTPSSVDDLAREVGLLPEASVRSPDAIIWHPLALTA